MRVILDDSFNLTIKSHLVQLGVGIGIIKPFDWNKPSYWHRSRRAINLIGIKIATSFLTRATPSNHPHINSNWHRVQSKISTSCRSPVPKSTHVRSGHTLRILNQSNSEPKQKTASASSTSTLRHWTPACLTRTWFMVHSLPPARIISGGMTDGLRRPHHTQFLNSPSSLS